jgi:hypothetical protein
MGCYKRFLGVFSRFLRKPGVFQDPSRVPHSGRVWVLGFPGRLEIRIPGSIDFTESYGGCILEG